MKSLARFGVGVGALVALALTSCATKDAGQSVPKPQDGIAEYHQIAVEAQKAVGAMVNAVAELGARTESCPPEMVAAFSRKVEKLQLESTRVRARAQAMQARGDAYFQNWEENLARVEDVRKRELAAQHHQELEQAFLRLKAASRETREAFQPFSTSLRELQTALENDAGAVRTETTRELIRATLQSGRQTEQCLAAVQGELDKMTAWLTPSEAASK